MSQFAENVIRAASLVVITGVIMALLIWTRPDTQAELQPLLPANVHTEIVRLMDIQPITRLTGKLQPVRKATLRFEVTGNVTARHVEPGQKVAAGEILLEVEDGDFVDAVEEARALLALERDAIRRDRHLLELTIRERDIQQREVERLERLGKDSLASKSKYDEALRLLLQQQEEEARLRYSVETADSRLKTHQAMLNRVERNLQRSRLTAPFDGTINSVSVEVGDFVPAGQSALELVQLDELDVYLEATGQVVNQLYLGQAVEVLVSEEQLTGKIIAISADPNPETHTHAVRIRLAAGNLYPGQLAQAVLPGKSLDDVKVVPVSAILQEEGQAYVFEIEDNHTVRKPVKLLIRHEDWQVISGIAPGAIIVARDVAALADGQEVHID
jgi:RND family efflux transporter MFP subunit